MAQLLKTCGIDRASPSVLDTITDIYIRHLNLVVETGLKYSNSSGRQQLAPQDIVLALEELGMLKPYKKYPAPGEEDTVSPGMKRFIDWCTSELSSESIQKVSRIAIDIEDDDEDEMESAVEKKTSQGHEQELHSTGQTVSSVVPSGDSRMTVFGVADSHSGLPETTEGHIKQRQVDWLTYLMKKASKGTKLSDKFRGTVLSDLPEPSDLFPVGGSQDIEPPVPLKRLDPVTDS